MKTTALKTASNVYSYGWGRFMAYGFFAMGKLESRQVGGLLRGDQH